MSRTLAHLVGPPATYRALNSVEPFLSVNSPRCRNLSNDGDVGSGGNYKRIPVMWHLPKRSPAERNWDLDSVSSKGGICSRGAREGTAGILNGSFQGIATIQIYRAGCCNFSSHVPHARVCWRRARCRQAQVTAQGDLIEATVPPSTGRPKRESRSMTMLRRSIADRERTPPFLSLGVRALRIVLLDLLAQLT